MDGVLFVQKAEPNFIELRFEGWLFIFLALFSNKNDSPARGDEFHKLKFHVQERLVTNEHCYMKVLSKY